MKKLMAFTLLFSLSAGAWTKKETHVRYTQEEADGQVFSHRVTVEGGLVEDLWTINGKQVEQEEYDNKYLQARSAELKTEIKMREEQHRAQEAEVAKQQLFARQSRILIYKKGLAEQVGGIERELARVQNPRLEPYYVFDASAFETKDVFLQLSSDLLTQAKELLAKSPEELSEAELLTISAQLEPQPMRLRDFYRVSVKHAINTCDDTKMLKEFLELLA
jgi:hypothetical protein